MEGVHELAFVFMQALDLYVKYRVGVDDDVCGTAHIVREITLVCRFDFVKAGEHRFVVGIFHEIFKLFGGFAAAGSDEFFDEIAEQRV